jgi:hypothetical protein
MSPKKDTGLTDAEKAAMKETLKERKAEERMNKDRAEGEQGPAREGRRDARAGPLDGRAHP